MLPRPLISILIVTRNEAANIGRNLEGIFSQEGGYPIEVIIIDSDSTDGTRAIAQGYADRGLPVQVVRIAKHEFHHGRTRNQLGDLSRGGYLVYLQGDAWPAHSQWLKNLVQPLLEDAHLGAVYGRQLPREDCDPINRFRYEWNYPEERRYKDVTKLGQLHHRLYFFSTANCIIRRELWARHRFPEDIPIFEDTTFAKRLIHGGHAIQYEPSAAVVHSHNLNAREIFARYRMVARVQRQHSFVEDGQAKFTSEGTRYVQRGLATILRHHGPIWAGRFLYHTVSGYVGLVRGGRATGPREGLGARACGRRIQIVTNLFHPDELAGASLYTDLARYLRDQGHEVRVTTTYSYYPAWKLRDADRGAGVRDEVFEGIPLRRVPMYVPARPSGAKRILSDLSFLWGLFWHAGWRDWEPDVVLTAEPMLSQCVALRLVPQFQRAGRLVIVQDFVVDAALELGMIRIPGLEPLLRMGERWALGAADVVTTISGPMHRKLEGMRLQSRRTLYLPNWIHQSLVSMIERVQAKGLARASNRLFYSGNVGVKQGLPDFLDVFAEVSSDWRLEIHGGGADIENLRTRVKNHERVVLGGVLDEDAYVERLLTATFCLITQKPGVSANFLPSKLLPALASGTPVIAVCEVDSPLGHEVQQGRFGVVIPPGDRQSLQDALHGLQSQPELVAQLGRNAKQHGELFSRRRVLGQIESLLDQVTS